MATGSAGSRGTVSLDANALKSMANESQAAIEKHIARAHRLKLLLQEQKYQHAELGIADNIRAVHKTKHLLPDLSKNDDNSTEDASTGQGDVVRQPSGLSKATTQALLRADLVPLLELKTDLADGTDNDLWDKIRSAQASLERHSDELVQVVRLSPSASVPTWVTTYIPSPVLNGALDLTVLQVQSIMIE